MTTNIKISIRRDRIQFENLGFPDDGNSYTSQAASAWECAAIEYLESAGYMASVLAGHGKDTTKFRIWVESTATNEDGDTIEITPEQDEAARFLADEADSVGMAAAIHFAETEAEFANPD